MAQQTPLGAGGAPPQQPALPLGQLQPGAAAGDLQWVDPWEGPPQGLEQAQHRQYYGGIRKVWDVYPCCTCCMSIRFTRPVCSPMHVQRLENMRTYTCSASAAFELTQVKV